MNNKNKIFFAVFVSLITVAAVAISIKNLIVENNRSVTSSAIDSSIGSPEKISASATQTGSQKTRTISSKETQITSAELERMMERQLRISSTQKIGGIRSKILMGLANPDGSRIGMFPGYSEKMAETPYHVFAGSEDRTDLIVAYNAKAGNYMLTLSTTEDETNFSVNISLEIKGKKVAEKIIDGITSSSQPKKYVIWVNNDALTISPQ